MFAEAAEKNIHPRIVAGVRWGLFSEAEAVKLPFNELCRLTEEEKHRRRVLAGITSVIRPKRRRVKRSAKKVRSLLPKRPLIDSDRVRILELQRQIETIEVLIRSSSQGTLSAFKEKWLSEIADRRAEQKKIAPRQYKALVRKKKVHPIFVQGGAPGSGKGS